MSSLHSFLRGMESVSACQVLKLVKVGMYENLDIFKCLVTCRKLSVQKRRLMRRERISSYDGINKGVKFD